MTREQFDVVIVGAGHAGAQAAIALRQTGFPGTIALVGDEPDPPYERPPLSKEYLKGERSFERILIRPPSFWAERNVRLMLGRRVTSVDAETHEVTCEDLGSIGYGALVWAAGGAARPLVCDGQHLPGVHTVRTRADADRLTGELPAVTSAVVVGGGFVGLEAAAVLTRFGKRVTLLEVADRVLARVAGEPLSRFYEAEHRANGVDVRLNVRVDRIEESDGRVAGVRLANGEVLACGLVIVGIGIVPAVAPLLAAGADGGYGVAVDAACRTSLPDVFAIGDCALHANAYASGERVRVESVQNANDQATVAAKVIAGLPATYDAVPWFWSNQYDLKLQTIGLSTGFDDCVTRGDPATRSFSVVYLKESRVVALDCVNATKDYVQGRALVTHRRSIAPGTLANASVPLKDM